MTCYYMYTVRYIYISTHTIRNETGLTSMLSVNFRKYSVAYQITHVCVMIFFSLEHQAIFRQ